MSTRDPSEPTSPTRVVSFAKFFKNYMSVSAIAIAALPIPVTSFKLIPTFEAQTRLLAVYTSLFCFLTLGFIFYARHELARAMFPMFSQKTTNFPRLSEFWRLCVTRLPLVLIATCILAVFQYNDVLILNANKVIENWTIPTSPPPTFNEVLAKAQLTDLPYGSRLIVLYLAIFLLAESAFVLMAIKEYLQDVIKLSEIDLILLRQRSDATAVLSGSESLSKSEQVTVDC